MLSTPPPPKYISAGIGPSPIFMTFFLLLSLPPRLRRKMLHGGGKSQLSNFEGKIAAVAFPLLYFPPMGGGRVAGFGMGCYYAEMSSPLSPLKKAASSTSKNSKN